jgi:hypothetical protein
MSIADVGGDVIMSAVGSKTEVAALRRDFCFAPVSGHRHTVGRVYPRKQALLQESNK